MPSKIGRREETLRRCEPLVIFQPARSPLACGSPLRRPQQPCVLWFGFATDCGVIITYNADGSVTKAATGQPPYDGSEDTTVGVVNDAGRPDLAVPLQQTTLRSCNLRL